MVTLLLVFGLMSGTWSGKGIVLSYTGWRGRLSERKAEDISREAEASAREYGLDPVLLLALAANESDFRWWLRRGHDCGITQVRVAGRANPRRACDRQVKSLRVAFMSAARILSSALTSRWCSWTADKAERMACALDVYNQGPKGGARAEKCIHGGRCSYRSLYWARVACFYEGMAARGKLRRLARRCRSIGRGRVVPSDVRHWLGVFGAKEKRKEKVAWQRTESRRSNAR